MKVTRVPILVLLATLFFALPALSDDSFVQDGWDRKSQYNHYFNPESMVYLSGEVVNIDRKSHPIPGMSDGFAVTVKTKDGKQHLVDVGPIWFTQFYKSKWDVAVGDQVDIRGSAVEIEGKERVMAIWGRKGDKEMTVRNLRGAPVWDLEIEDF
jgi:hypothetical protein